MKMLLAVLLGNLLFFAVNRSLPAHWHHARFSIDPGLLVDFAMCGGAYLIIRKIV